MAPLTDTSSLSGYLTSSEPVIISTQTTALSKTDLQEINAIQYFIGFGLALLSTILLGLAYIFTKHAIDRNDKRIVRTLVRPPACSAPSPTPSSSTSGSARAESPAPPPPLTDQPSCLIASHANGISHRHPVFNSSENPLPSISTDASAAPKLASEGGIGYLREKLWWFGTILSQFFLIFCLINFQIHSRYSPFPYNALRNFTVQMYSPIYSGLRGGVQLCGISLRASHSRDASGRTHSSLRCLSLSSPAQ